MKLDVQTHFSQGWDIGLIEKARELGVEEIRDSQPWGKIETTKGVYAFPSGLTNYMDAAEGAGIASLLTFGTGNALYDSGLTPYTDAGRKAYAEHILAVLRAYGGQVQEIEVWNEFNTASFKGPAAANDAYFYTELLKTVYETVKPIFPEVKILGGSVNSIGIGALEDIFELGALTYMDGVAIHPYRSQPEHVDAEIARLQAVVERFGGAKPIYATEFGKAFDSPSEAPDYMVKMVTLMASVGVEESYWYALIDQKHFINMGLLTQKGEAKPAAEAFTFIKEQLLSLGDPVRIDTGDDKTLIYRFGADTYVMWGSERPLTLTGGTVRNSQGETIAAPDHLSMAPIIVKGATYSLGESRVIADSLMQFGEGDWQYFAKYKSGTLTELEMKDWEWTSYLGSQYTKPLRVNADSIAPGGDAARPVQVVERFVSDRDQKVGIDGTWRTNEGDGIDLHILVNGVEVFSKVFSGAFVLSDFVVDLKAGDTLDFAVGPNQSVIGDSTARHIVLTRIDPVASAVPVSDAAMPAPIQAGVERVGTAGDDVLDGTELDDRLFGGDGQDRLSGGEGDDLLSGGSGRNFIDGGEGFDTVTYADSDVAVDVRLSILQMRAVSSLATDQLVDVEGVIGSRFEDRLSGSGRDEAFDGGEGNDTIHASLGDDRTDGGAGVDTLSFLVFDGSVSVNLALTGRQDVAPGASMIIGSIEVLVGSSSADRLQASETGSRIDGGRGDDVILGGAGDDDLYGGAGRNTVSYAAASTGVRVDLSLDGDQETGAGRDTLQRFHDLVGSSHADRLVGNNAANRVDGGAGNDTIVGGAGADVLIGGTGADVFLFAAASESKTKSPDTILDFSRVEGDRIDLQGVDAIYRTARNESFTLVDAFSRKAGELVIQKEEGRYLVLADTGGDGVADFTLHVVTSGPFSASDLIL